MIKKVVERLVELGTQPQKEPKHNQITRLINKICVFVILVIIPYLLLTLYFHSTLATLVQLIAILALGLTIFLNSKQFFNLARVLTLLIGNFHIFAMVLILGLESGIHFYFSAAIIAPLFFYTFKELRYILLFGTLTIILALLIQFLGIDLKPIVEIPEKLTTFFFYFSVAGSLLIVFIFVLHFYIELQKAHDEVKVLSGFLPICASCKKIKDDKGYWNQIESYIMKHSDAHFSHLLCEECSDKLYGNEEWFQKGKKKREKKT
jgi:hypothetical protein